MQVFVWFFFFFFYDKCFIFSNIVITIIITRCTNLSLFIAGLFSFLIFHFPLLHFFKLSFFFFSYFVLAFNIFTPLFLYVSFHPIDILHILKCVFEHSIFYFCFLLFTFLLFFKIFLVSLDKICSCALLYTHLLVVIFQPLSLFSCNYENIL